MHSVQTQDNFKHKANRYSSSDSVIHTLQGQMFEYGQHGGVVVSTVAWV